MGFLAKIFMTEDSKKNSLSNRFTVQKSKPLLALWNSNLTLQELKILDIYLSKIDSHKPENRVVTFSKGEMEKILGVSKINMSTLKTRLKSMLSTVVEIPDRDEKNGFRLITVFEEANAYHNDSGICEVRLECNEKAMKYIFNIESLGYIKYKLQCITRLNSRYSYVMFMYLEDNRFRGEWDVSLDEIRSILGCNAALYQQYRTLNERILVPAYNELKDMCSYEYTPIKTNRVVTGLHVKITEINRDNSMLINSDNTSKDEPIVFENNHKEVWMSAIKGWGLTNSEILELRELIIAIPHEKLPHVPEEIGCDDIELRRYHYVQQKVAEMNRRCGNIKNRFLYIKKTFANDTTQNS